MTVREALSSVFGFRPIPTTILLVLLYAAVFSTVLVTDELPEIPNDRQGLDLDQANADLHFIARAPHPYNSHTNDAVREYIHTRLQDIASQHSHVHLSSDLVSNASWASLAGLGTYFEGTNLLVKIDGTDPTYAESGGVLFSAHYDSVSTTPGATDDGMGVTTLLQMVQYLAERRPQRTSVFNINNGEEDGLSGAHAFLEHPWSSIPDTFLNLEGAASGGRPMLFRSTTTAPLYSFLNKNVPHPHSNVISADAFARGVIRSATDYSIYEKGGMDGLDFAFYKGRSKYHTKYDSVPGTEGGLKALWAMMEGTRGAGSALVNDAATHGKGDGAVYFDLFAAVLIVFKLNTLFTANIVLLAAGPIAILLLIYSRYAVQRPTRGSQSGEAALQRGWKNFKRFGWLKGLWKITRFWLALAIGVGLQVLLVVGYLNLNPFIVYSHPYIVLTSALSLAYLSTVLVLNLPVAASPPDQQKLAILLHTYLLTWILLLVCTIVLAKLHLGGIYWVSAWNAVALVGSVLALLEAIVTARSNSGVIILDSDDEERGDTRYVSGIRYDVAGSDDGQHEGEEVETEPTEITPLVQQRRRVSKKDQDGTIGWWILQMLVVVPVPAILIFHIGVFLLAALAQTLADGSSAVNVYASVSVLALITVLPLAPFSISIHRSLSILVLVLFIASTAYTWLAFPFSQEAPIKVYFQQHVELDLGYNSNSAHSGNAIRVVSEIISAPGYLDAQILPQLPSTWGTDTLCTPGGRMGLWACTWEGGLIPFPDATSSKKYTAQSEVPSSTWLTVNITRLSPGSARISIKGVNTRACRLYFDAPITQYRVHGPDGYVSENMQSGYEIPSSGLQEVRLWSREWDREFVVDVDTASDGTLSGRAACEWAEYESATAGSGASGRGGRIPALEEVLSFLPRWAVVSKSADGLVEAWGNFTI
ncbi:hypothetical protein PLICRDRAFT_98578 [Plicaturopsis crispa FD-325 SS-3]|nr:hypothetical protein PLICRDRAFT_98578 [Plicaturopsis crispa FD-325 SS-3]